MIHTYSYTQERPFNCPAMAFSSDVDLKIDSRLEDRLPVTVFIFRCFVASSPMSRRYIFRIRWFSAKFFAALKYPSLQTIDMNERKTGAMTVNRLHIKKLLRASISWCKVEKVYGRLQYAEYNDTYRRAKTAFIHNLMTPRAPPGSFRTTENFLTASVTGPCLRD